jgi:hypothetical protein
MADIVEIGSGGCGAICAAGDCGGGVLLIRFEACPSQLTANEIRN